MTTFVDWEKTNPIPPNRPATGFVASINNNLINPIKNSMSIDIFFFILLGFFLFFGIDMLLSRIIEKKTHYLQQEVENLKRLLNHTK